MKLLPHVMQVRARTTIAATIAGSLLLFGLGYTWYFADRIAPNTWVGTVPVSGLTSEKAAERLEGAIQTMDHSGIILSIGDKSETLLAASIGLDLNLAQAIDDAFARGHSGGVIRRLWERIAALWRQSRLAAPVRLDDAALASQIDQLAETYDRGRRDIALQVEGKEVTLMTDTEPGKLIDRQDAVRRISAAAMALDTAAITLTFRADPPQIDASTASEAVEAAQRMMARALTLTYEDAQFTITRERIGSWIISEYDEDQLLAGLDRELIAEYITGIAGSVNVDPKPPVITTENGQVIGFEPPEVGKAVQEDALIGMIWDNLMARSQDKAMPTTLVIPMKTTRMELAGLDDTSGITEIIGVATTTFAGSPKNRILNIKNGVKFLTGALIQPGQEFSTLGTLGTIDNSTGYLPELVIKGDRTTPEFGGGLCQVSTTLFRAVMDAGLPITARRNHSFRVGYYEKDGNGKNIGPGLDATIYEPATDFRFVNDTAHPIIIIGYVAGTKVTFELYGTGDGRTSQIIGPKILTETPPGEPVYIETLDLPPGEIKQVEFPHPGGSTTATYVINYPDGRAHSNEFVSWYRKWPAKYLKGVSVLSTPTPTPPVTAPFEMP